MISHPRSDIFSTFPILTKRFQLQYYQDVARYRGGASVVTEMAPPSWAGEWMSATLKHRECVELESMLNSLGGALQPFYCEDTRRYEPRVRAADLSDVGTVGTVSTANSTLTLNGYVANALPVFLSRGDLISVDYSTASGTRTTVLEVLEGTDRLASGNTSTFQVSPRPHSAIATGNAVRLLSPSILMQLVPGSVQYNDRGNGLGSVSFSAVEYR